LLIRALLKRSLIILIGLSLIDCYRFSTNWAFLI